jgi:hypothetical protein
MNEQSQRCDLCGARFDTAEQLRDHWDQTHETQDTREPIGTSARS